MNKTDTKVSPYVIYNNWLKDGNLNSPYPKELEENKYVITPTIILNHFIQSPKYFIFINNLYNNMNLFYLKVSDIAKTVKEAYYYTRYTSYNSKKKTEAKPNALIDILKQKYPYYKKEEILMVVNIIDNSEEKDTIYEMFGLKGNVKAKKMTKKEISERKDKINNIVTSSDIMDMI